MKSSILVSSGSTPDRVSSNTPQSSPGSGRKYLLAGQRHSSILSVLYLVAALLFLYNFLFVPPFVPIQNYPAGDWYFAATPAQMMVERGESIYRDVFDFAMPGTTLIDAVIFKVVGLRPWIPNALSMILGLGLAGLSLAISRRIMHRGIAFFYRRDPG